MSATQRRIVYGANVALTIVLAVALLAFAVWAAGRFGGRIDLTRTGRNSLSPRTVKLLRGLDHSIRLTGLYSTALKEIRPYAEKRRKRVGDLLNLYETAAHGKVTTYMIDPRKQQAKVSELLQRLVAKPAYRDEAKPHEEALDEFPALNAEISRVAQEETTRFQEFVKSHPRLGRVPQIVILARNLQHLIREAELVTADVQELTQDDIPRYGRAVEVVRDHLTQTRAYLEDARTWMTTEGAALPGLASEVKELFQRASERFGPVLSRIDAALARTEDLKRVKLEDTYEELKRGETILVETDDQAQVLALNDVWPFRTDRGAPPPPDHDPRDFAGERAVSSAVLQLTQKEKTAVVFTRFGGVSPIRPDFSQMNPMMRQLPRAPYQELKELLEKENFLTEDWDVAAQPTPPDVKGAGRTVYVVFPPQPPPQPDPRRPSPVAGITPEQVQTIVDAVNASGMAVFLAGFAPPPGGMPFGVGKYEFAEYLKAAWGIDVQFSHVVWQFMPNPQKPGLKWPAHREPLLAGDKLHFTDHPIVEPLHSLPAALWAAAPLRIVTGDEKPAGVTVEIVAEVPETEDVWALEQLSRLEDDLRKRQGTTRRESDVAAPFPVVLAASNQDDQRVVVISSERFAADEIVRRGTLVLAGNTLQTARLYPANLELMLNALHWLTRDADRIAVGPRQSDVPRLDKLKEDATAQFWRVFLVGIWPGLALAAGAVVWLVRRR